MILNVQDAVLLEKYSLFVKHVPSKNVVNLKKYITNYPVKLAREIILRSIPSIREMGVKDFIQAEIKRYTCPNCGNSLFRGVKRCNSCKIELNVDL